MVDGVVFFYEKFLDKKDFLLFLLELLGDVGDFEGFLLEGVLKLFFGLLELLDYNRSSFFIKAILAYFRCFLYKFCDLLD